MKNIFTIVALIGLHAGVMVKPSIAQEAQASHPVYIFRTTLCNIFIGNETSSKTRPIHELLRDARITWRGFGTYEDIQEYLELLSSHYQQECQPGLSSYTSKYDLYELTRPLELDNDDLIIRRPGSQIYLSCSTDPSDAVSVRDRTWISKWWMSQCNN